MKYVVPEFREPAFTCPRCGVYAHMEWAELVYFFTGQGITSPIHVVQCVHCQGTSFWLKYEEPEGQESDTARMIVPSGAAGPLPHPEMPTDVKIDYDEAREVCGASPRAAAALLRLAIQKLCRDLGEAGKDINTDIGNLVKKGLPAEIQQALDIIRVVGNNAVHPGELSSDDVAKVALSLFELTNQIVEDMIAKPKKLSGLFTRLPRNARDAIEKRDGKAQKAGP